MKSLLRSEEAFMLAASLLFFHMQNFSWMWFWILFLAPDLGMLGYLVNSKAGAISYNLFHHKGIAIVIFIIGFYYSLPQFEFAGILLFAHSSFDRMLGYGLKYHDSFNHTHLGMIGKKVITHKEQ
jgi:hypothetical protein